MFQRLCSLTIDTSVILLKEFVSVAMQNPGVGDAWVPPPMLSFGWCPDHLYGDLKKVGGAKHIPTQKWLART